MAFVDTENTFFTSTCFRRHAPGAVTHGQMTRPCTENHGANGHSAGVTGEFARCGALNRAGVVTHGEMTRPCAEKHGANGHSADGTGIHAVRNIELGWVKENSRLCVRNAVVRLPRAAICEAVASGIAGANSPPWSQGRLGRHGTVGGETFESVASMTGHVMFAGVLSHCRIVHPVECRVRTCAELRQRRAYRFTSVCSIELCLWIVRDGRRKLIKVPNESSGRTNPLSLTIAESKRGIWCTNASIHPSPSRGTATKSRVKCEDQSAARPVRAAIEMAFYYIACAAVRARKPRLPHAATAGSRKAAWRIGSDPAAVAGNGPRLALAERVRHSRAPRQAAAGLRTTRRRHRSALTARRPVGRAQRPAGGRSKRSRRKVAHPSAACRSDRPDRTHMHGSGLRFPMSPGTARLLGRSQRSATARRRARSGTVVRPGPELLLYRFNDRS